MGKGRNRVGDEKEIFTISVNGQKLVHAGRVYFGGCNKAESIFIKPKLEFVGMNVPIFAGAKKIAI